MTTVTARQPEPPEGLFDIDPAQIPPEPPKLTADQRRVQRQAETLAAGYHPVTKLKLHEEAAPAGDRKAEGRRCGNCRFRMVLGYRNKSFAKCLNPGGMGADEIDVIGPPYVTHGAATDVRRWWPACDEHSYGDRALSDDAARYVPQAVSS
jgi:hypothetical protein